MLWVGLMGNVVWDWCRTYIATLSFSQYILCNSFVSTVSITLSFLRVHLPVILSAPLCHCTHSVQMTQDQFPNPCYLFLFFFNNYLLSDHCSCGHTVPALVLFLMSCDLHNAQRCRKCICVIGVLHSQHWGKRGILGWMQIILCLFPHSFIVWI